jgi:hypothetical protein
MQSCPLKSCIAIRAAVNEAKNQATMAFVHSQVPTGH